MGGRMIEANFSQAVRLCKGKNSTVVDPASPEEANKLSSMVAKRAQGNGGLWINYHDIHMKATLIGTDDNAVLLDSKYMAVFPRWLKYQTKCGECMVRMTLIILLITSTVYIGPGVLHTKWSVLLKCP